MDVNATNGYGKTALYTTIGSVQLSQKDTIRITRLLLKKGADVNIKDKRGYPLLIEAVRKGSSIEILDVLMEHGLEINAKDDRGSTALHWSARFGKIEYVKYLLSKGADPLIENLSGYTPLSYAESNSKDMSGAIVEFLKKRTGGRGD